MGSGGEDPGGPLVTLRPGFLAAVCFAAALFVAGLVQAQEGEAAEAGDEIPERSGPVMVVRIDGSINPAASDYLQKAIVQSEEAGASILLFELDTPGGLVSATQDMIQAMLGSKVPVVVYVSPQGAWAGSAGTFLTIAAHVAAMAPGSSIGAAHPVGLGGTPPPTTDEEGEQKPSDYGTQKAENLLAAFIESVAEKRGRNVEWAAQAVRESVAVTAEEALEINVIDLVAASRASLLEQLQGREVAMDDGPIRLNVEGARIEEIEMSAVTRVMHVIADPAIAGLLFMAGLLGLYIEFNQPGTFIPGAIGAVCLVLALIAMQVLPFSWVGVLLILAGMALFVAEVFITSYGVLFAAGIACLLVGGSMIFDRPDVSDLTIPFWPVLVPAVSGMAIFAGIVVIALGRSHRLEQQSGTSEMQGMQGTASTPLDPTGTVYLRGEYWRALADAPVAEGDPVVVVAVEGLQLRVRSGTSREA
jgi:membrane-bound serine protease (ClpP class)